MTSDPPADVVLDDDDRILHVGPAFREAMGPFVSHVIWTHLPLAEPLLRPGFDEARATAREVVFSAFYAGSVRRFRARPARDGLAIRVDRGTELDVTTLATLAESLRRIEEELAAREPERLDPPAPASLQALP